MGLLGIALFSYLIGSIPSGYLAGRLGGVDIRQQGSGNIGATNVTRVLGKRYGYPVFLADFIKGFSAVFLAPLLGRYFDLSCSTEVCQVVAGVFVVIGNAFPFWLRFRGGKGVATSAGLFFALIPVAAVIATLIWIIAFYTTRYVSLASVMAALALPLTVFIIHHVTGVHRPFVLGMTATLAAIVILRHRTNLARLMRGTEQRFERREH
ncbi:MAG TPA: glycerol-3-phosphate 1-O-acyltransferase PlsY [Chthoniobacterales bacterium]